MSGWTDYGFPDLKLVTPTKAFTGIIKALHERDLWDYLEHPETRVLSRQLGGHIPDKNYLLDPVYYYGTTTYQTSSMHSTAEYSFLRDFMNVLNNIDSNWCDKDSDPDNFTPIKNSDWNFSITREIFPLVNKFPAELIKRIYDKINLLFRLEVRFPSYSYGYGNYFVSSYPHNIEYKKILLHRHLFLSPSEQEISPGEIRSRLLDLPLAASNTGSVAEDFYINNPAEMKIVPLYTDYCHDEELNWRNLNHWNQGQYHDTYNGARAVYAESSALKFNYYQYHAGCAADSILFPVFRHTFEHNVTFEFNFKILPSGNASQFSFFSQFPSDGKWHKIVFENVPPLQEVRPIQNFVLPSDFAGDDGWGAWYGNYESRRAFFLNLKCENGLEFFETE